MLGNGSWLKPSAVSEHDKADNSFTTKSAISTYCQQIDNAILASVIKLTYNEQAKQDGVSTEAYRRRNISSPLVDILKRAHSKLVYQFLR